MQTTTAKGEPIHSDLWRKLDATAKWVLIGRGKVVIDDDGRPCVVGDATIKTVADVEAALGLRRST